MGYLPDDLAREAQRLRCRRCSARFMTDSLSSKGADQRARAPRESSGTSRTQVAAVPFVADAFFAGFDESEPAIRPLGPDDSQYELTFSFQDPQGGSGVDWPAEPADDPEFEAARSGEFAASFSSGEVATSEPWYYRFIDSSGRLLFIGALILVIMSLPLLGFLLVHVLGGSAAVNPTTLALIVGSVAAMSFLFISLAITALNVLLVDLARNIRRLRDHADRKAGIVRG
jgi:hypothetical protein